MSDPVISEVRAIKRQIVAEHGGDLDSFFAAIRQRQALNPRLVQSTGGEKDASSNPCQPPGSDDSHNLDPHPKFDFRTRW